MLRWGVREGLQFPTIFQDVRLIAQLLTLLGGSERHKLLMLPDV